MRTEYHLFRRILKLLEGIRMHPMYLLIPLVLSFFAALFEGVGMGLLIPLINGFLREDFSFIKETPGLSVVNDILPSAVLQSDKLLFLTLITVFVLAIVLKNIFKYFSILGMRFLASRSIHHLRKVLFQRYLGFGKLYFDATSIGHHSTVLMNFAKMALRPVLVMDKYVNAFFSLLIYLCVMLFISWRLTIFTLPLFFLLHVSMQRLVTLIRTYAHIASKRLSALTNRGVEMLSLIPLIKAYDTEELEKRRYAEISDGSAGIELKIYAVEESLMPFQELLTLFSALVLFGGMLYIKIRTHESMAPSFIVYFYLVLNAANKFGALTGFRSALSDASGALEEVEEIFRDEGKFVVPGGKRRLETLRESIEFSRLTFSYPGGRSVLRDVSFRIAKGKMTAIVGPTGSGKTTIINLLMRFYDCPSRSIRVDGEDIRSYSLPSLHRAMALVSQDTMLLNDTVRANILYGLSDIAEGELEGAVAHARLAEFVERLPQGLETVIGERGVKLSGGEKQRISIARALLKGSEILILDEATSSLDSRTETLIQEAIDEAVTGRTAIVIAHRLSTIRHSDRIVVLDDGRIAETGTLNELLEKKGLFEQLWQAQQFR